MKALLCLFLLAANTALVWGVCNLGLGRRANNDFEMYTLHATVGPVVEAQNMSLLFDYQVNPVDTVQLTLVQINTSLERGCVTTFPASMNLMAGFEITVKTFVPVTQFFGTATVYGIRRGN